MRIGTQRLARLRRTAPLAALLLTAAGPALSGGSLSDRLNLDYLRRCREAAGELRKLERVPGSNGGMQDIRCSLHVHSRLSHDSRGTPEEIAAAAKSAGVRAVFMTEHPQPDRRWWTEGYRGEREGVFFIPGAELSDGLLLWGSSGEEWSPEMKAGEILERLGAGALSFVAHPEQRPDAGWELPPFHGMEIYNCHADAADSDYTQAFAVLRGGNPFRVVSFLDTFHRFPIESYAAIFDEQKAVLKRWDELGERYLRASTGKDARRCVGIAANDAHQNVGIRIHEEGDRLIIRDALDKQIGRLPKLDLGLLFGADPGRRPGDPILVRTFDPYAVSFAYVSTHLLLDTGRPVSEEALFAALRGGSAYVAFDWLSDPTGFSFEAEGGRGERAVGMGGVVRAARKPRLTVRAPISCELRLLRNGVLHLSAEGTSLSADVAEPGLYRVEAWLPLAGERRPWIYSNPIYVR